MASHALLLETVLEPTPCSRAQAFEHGALVDATEPASRIPRGFRGLSVALTAAVREDLEATEPGSPDTYGRRLHHVLDRASLTLRQREHWDRSEAVFPAMLQVGRRTVQWYRIQIELGDAGEPVITIGKR